MDNSNSEDVFLNLIVQKVCADQIQTFMKTWMRQESKDFRLVFIQDESTTKEEQLAIKYAIRFSEALGLGNRAVVVSSVDDAPKAKVTKFLKDTSSFPYSKLDVLKSKNDYKDRVKTDLTIFSKGTNKTILQSLEQKNIQIQQKQTEIKPIQKNKIVCYTCITGNYDQLQPISNKQPNIDYVCFTDQQIKNSNGWIVKNIPKCLESLNPIIKQRIIKIRPDLFLKEYDLSLWIDGKIKIVGNINDIIKNHILDDNHLIYAIKHQKFNSLFQDATEVLAQHKEDNIPVAKQMLRFRLEKYEDKNGFFDTAILLRSHNNNSLVNAMRLWERFIVIGSFRDQLSFTYCLNKNSIKCQSLNISYPTNEYLKAVGFHVKNSSQFGKDVVIGIVNFNTTRLTNACIKSIIKNVKSLKYHIIVVDNSTQDQKFRLDVEINKSLVTVIDNTSKQIVDFEKEIIANNCIRVRENNNASLKHALTIQWMFDNITTNDFILMDSDTILKTDIDSNILDRSRVMVGQIYPLASSKPRIEPFIQYFNFRMLYTRKCNIQYLDINRMHGGNNRINSSSYDTGASFYEDCMKSNLPIKIISTNKYINHLKAASWKDKNMEMFLEENKCFFYDQRVKIGIVNFNTTQLTNACIKSIIKNVKSLKYHIIVVDNSTQDQKFKLDPEIDKALITIFDNTKGQLINLDSFVEMFGKVQVNKKIKTHPSLRHSLTIQWMLDNIDTDDFILMDSDVIVKKDFSCFVDQEFITSGEIYIDKNPNGWKPRIRPFLQYLNVNKIRKNKMTFLDPNRIHEGLSFAGNHYDTGASFYEDCISRKMKIKEIPISDYIIHFGAGSYLKTVDDMADFIKTNNKYL